MANHLTPEEASQEFDLTVGQVEAICLIEGLPRIDDGKVCRGLFGPTLERLRAHGRVPEPELATVGA